MRSFFFLLLLSSAALADPSTTSIETGVMGNLKAKFVVADSDEQQIADRTWIYWVAMPNTSASEVSIELANVSFSGSARGADIVECNVADCFGVFKTLRISPDETLYVTSNREILSLTLSVPTEEQSLSLPTLVGLFSDCVRGNGALVDAIFARYRRYTKLSYVPFPAALDLGLFPVCVR